MDITAITCCVNFSDYLRLTLSNKVHFKKWLIVTDINDYKTIQLCSNHALIYVLSNKFFKDGCNFAKGSAINDALKFVNKTNWLLFIDADIKLPDNFLDLCKRTVNNKKVLYGCHRYYNGKCMTPSNVFWPISGYFQLCHASQVSHYPSISGNASTDDWKFYYDFLSKESRFGQYLNFPVTAVNADGCANWNGI